MKELDLFVSRASFDPNRISMSTIMSVLRMGMKLAVRCYQTGELIGRFIPSNCQLGGYAFIKAAGARS